MYGKGTGDRLGEMKTGRVWMTSSRESSWKGEQWIVAQEKEGK
jgi:hypothetical protein